MDYKAELTRKLAQIDGLLEMIEPQQQLIARFRAALRKGEWAHGFRAEDGGIAWFLTDPRRINDRLFTDPEWQQEYRITLTKEEALALLPDLAPSKETHG